MKDENSKLKVRFSVIIVSISHVAQTLLEVNPLLSN